MCVVIIFLIIALLVWCSAVHVSREGFDLTNGSTGPKGDTGPMGGTGPQGIQGIRGQDGINGASIFDVSRIMLNGDTDIFSKKVDDAEPQPSTAYTTLFG
jgi:hypothetical protein